MCRQSLENTTRKYAVPRAINIPGPERQKTEQLPEPGNSGRPWLEESSQPSITQQAESWAVNTLTRPYPFSQIPPVSLIH